MLRVVSTDGDLIPCRDLAVTPGCPSRDNNSSYTERASTSILSHTMSSISVCTKESYPGRSFSIPQLLYATKRKMQSVASGGRCARGHRTTTAHRIFDILILQGYRNHDAGRGNSSNNRRWCGPRRLPVPVIIGHRSPRGRVGSPQPSPVHGKRFRFHQPNPSRRPFPRS